MLFCEDVELMLQDYLDGYLLPSQREVLETHVRGCDQCRALVGGLTRLDRSLDELSDVEVPDGLSSSILGALPPQCYGPSPLRRALSRGAAPLLAVFLVVAAFLLKDRFQLHDRVAERDVVVDFSAPQAVSVAVVGDFNAWNPQRTKMVRENHEGRWTVRLKLAPGVHQYSFVIDGTHWVADPRAKSALDDGFGGQNSIIIVDG